MRKLALTLCMALLPLLSFAQHNTKKAGIVFHKEVIDYGKIEHNSNGVRYFRYTNTGDAPLVITKVKGSCGCTVPTKPDEPLMPGEVGEIKVKYATDRMGRFSKTVTVTSNATEVPKVVRIKGEVIKTK